MVGEFVVKQEGNKRLLIIDYKGASVSPDLAAYPQVMRDVIQKLQTNEADEVVLSEYYERIYNEEQTAMLRGIADLVTKFETETVWSLSHLGTNYSDKKTLSARHDIVLGIFNETLVDPFAAYMELIKILKEETAELHKTQEAGDEKGVEDLKVYIGTLQFMKNLFDLTSMIKRSKQYLAQLGKLPEGRAVYHSLFESAIKPSFIGSRIFFTGTETLELVDQYEVLSSKVYIYKHPEKIEYLYYINPPEYTLPPEKYFLLQKTKEVVAGHRPTSVGFMDMEQARKYFRKIYVATITDLANQNNINLSVEEKEELATIVSRYTIGYGILELLLSDRQLTDVYIDSPLGSKPIYLVHSKYGQCQTNIIFSEEEAKSTVSRFRALSGRPFDEAHPILDFDLADLQTRIAAIGKPLAVDGTAFALRLHKDTPWTLAQFVDFKMMPPLAAGILSFFVDAQASMLIVGSRGSGKTSMLQALMQEIPQNLRIIVQEDSVTGDSQIVVERNGRLERTTVGELIDGLISKGEKIDIDGKEIVPVNSENIKVFSLNKQGKMQLTKVSQFTRHKVTKPIYEVETVTGKKIKVTGDHSLFTQINNETRAIKTNQIKPGTQIATVDQNENNSNDQVQLQLQLTWELVSQVTPIKTVETYVYDFSVPECENFVCENIIAHNTQELPIPQLKQLGFNVQRLKTRPPLGAQSEAEVSAEDALRTALRLGDSVLIVGEVRSGEAKALYEAMRVGAVGNVVMGTIHGESAYSIWDRVVNDLGVPTTSFKATDMTIVAAPIRFKGSLKRYRRLIEITEVKKNWNEDPGRENGFLNWMLFDANKDNLEFFKDDVKESEWIKKVMRNRGLKYEDVWNEIVTRAASKQYLIDVKNKHNIPKILEADNTIHAHTKLMILAEKHREEFGKLDHKQVLADWQEWVDNVLVKQVVGLKTLG